jgi:hypothetical protein
MRTKTVGDYRVELHVLPAEPFFTKEEIAAKHVKEGMQIEGGAAPVPLDAPSHPNHHLVVHVFDQKSGRALTAAKVTLRFAPLDDKGKAVGASVEVPGGDHAGDRKRAFVYPLWQQRHDACRTLPSNRRCRWRDGSDVSVSDTPPGPAKPMKM